MNGFLAALSIVLQAFNPRPVLIESKEFDDLEFLKARLQHVQVVEIGEATHGAAEFYRLKTRLVRFLHEELGFNTLIIESGVIETTLAMASRKRYSPDSLLDATVFENFRWQESRPLFEYLISRPKLTAVGMDPQFSSDEVLRLAAETVRPLDAQLADQLQSRLGEPYQYMGLTSQPEQFRSKRDAFLKWLGDAQRRVSSLSSTHKGNTQLQVLASSLADLKRYWNYEPTTAPFERFGLRDKIMAENAIRKIGSQKAIIWAHNGHIGKGLGYKIAGDHLRDKLGNKLFSIGLFGVRGSFYEHWTKQVKPWLEVPSSLVSDFSGPGDAWFSSTDGMTKKTRAYEPENGGTIEFVPSDRFQAVFVVKNLTPPKRR